MEISLISLAENPHFVVPEDGRYIVRVERSTDKTVLGKYTTVTYINANVKRHLEAKTNTWHNSIDCRGEITHISETPVK